MQVYQLIRPQLVPVPIPIVRNQPRHFRTCSAPRALNTQRERENDVTFSISLSQKKGQCGQWQWCLSLSPTGLPSCAALIPQDPYLPTSPTGPGSYVCTTRNPLWPGPCESSLPPKAQGRRSCCSDMGPNPSWHQLTDYNNPEGGRGLPVTAGAPRLLGTRHARQSRLPRPLPPATSPCEDPLLSSPLCHCVIGKAPAHLTDQSDPRQSIHWCPAFLHTCLPFGEPGGSECCSYLPERALSVDTCCANFARDIAPLVAYCYSRTIPMISPHYCSGICLGSPFSCETSRQESCSRSNVCVAQQNLHVTMSVMVILQIPSHLFSTSMHSNLLVLPNRAPVIVTFYARTTTGSITDDAWIYSGRCSWYSILMLHRSLSQHTKSGVLC